MAPSKSTSIGIKLGPEHMFRLRMIQAYISVTNPMLGKASWQNCVEWLVDTCPIEELIAAIKTAAPPIPDMSKQETLQITHIQERTNGDEFQRHVQPEFPVER